MTEVNGDALGHPLLTQAIRIRQRLRRTDRAHPWLLDAAVVAGVVLLFCVPEFVRFDDGDDGPLPITFTQLPVPATLALQAGLVLPLLARRRAPTAAFAVIAAVFVLQWSLGSFLRADVALLVALYSVALHGRVRHLAWVGAAVAGLIVPVAVRVSAVVSVWGALFFLISTAVAAAALGLAVRIRRAQLAALRERAARLEVERDQRSRLATATERTRVAREMHDIIGHNLSVIISLADGGAYAAEAAPERSREALRLVGESGRQALGELRRMLGVLREQAAAPELHPQPRIADIDALCGRLRAAGPEVVLRSGGELEALDRGVQLMAYRIVQEALTNTLKHAGPGTRVDVTLSADGARLRIRVQDTGPPDGRRPSHGEGHGLTGMRERAALYGGTLVAGPVPGGGWAVQAVLDVTPLPGSPA
ncbi:sensor histidine kinase [Amycolatopsis sp. Hca4]|uniref:sensor histidine kinase n=1 Tax=Amycolatopsis sp. Hca4 TaxID=2742131 RepID=UPI001592565B|nr:histidine kinase [Amycolatopsis sp. Hca4]QKV78857.1 sensor histidine kinase [Amycolatopsis sp. Hca4]